VPPAVSLTVEEDGGEHQLCLEMANGTPVPPVYVDYVFAAVVGRIRMKIRPCLEMLRVELRQPEPPASGKYGEVFRAPVRFGADRDRLCINAEESVLPMDTADAALAPDGGARAHPRAAHSARGQRPSRRGAEGAHVRAAGGRLGGGRGEEAPRQRAHG
jgi:hypothetical protein